MNISDFIPYGRENAVTRKYLSSITGCTDRAIREMIKREIKNGVHILSSSQHSGYWKSDDIEEIEAFIRESDRRRATEAMNVESLRFYVAKQKGYKMIPVKAHYRTLGR